jgi:DNA invertase Pin-like site-specific DNA recombinase
MIIYTRVSTDDQKDGTSPETQLRRAREMADKNEWQIVKEERSDEGISGTLFLARPGIQSALAMIKAGEADGIIFSTLDRAARNAKWAITIREEIQKAGVSIAARCVPPKAGLVCTTRSVCALPGF